jgi:hypothetical protein
MPPVLLDATSQEEAEREAAVKIAILQSLAEQNGEEE